MLEHVLLRCGLVEHVAELEVFVTDPHAVIGRREACWRVRLRAGAHSEKHGDRLCAGHFAQFELRGRRDGARYRLNNLRRR